MDCPHGFQHRVFCNRCLTGGTAEGLLGPIRPPLPSPQEMVGAPVRSVWQCTHCYCGKRRVNFQDHRVCCNCGNQQLAPSVTPPSPDAGQLATPVAGGQTDGPANGAQ